MQTDLLKEIFDRQRELAISFHHIERVNGLWTGETLQVDLTTLRGQERMRSLAWRVIEELAEGLDERDELVKAREELVDVGHYLIELMLCANLGVSDIRRRLPALEELDTLDATFAVASYGRLVKNSIDTAVGHFVTDLGMALHHLKFKPHKVNPRPTNVVAFQSALVTAFLGYCALLASVGIKARQFYEGYLRKNSINHERIAQGV